MITKVVHGRDTAGLLAYLYGPGEANEHTDAHMVAAWDHAALDPARDADLEVLAGHLDRMVRIVRPAGWHVWHCSVRAAPEDPILSDAQWAQIAADVVDAAGIAPHGDQMACRWVAVRHAEDHIHIAATTVRQDGRRPDLHCDWLRLRRRCRSVEGRHGLRSTSPADGTAASDPKRGELRKARRMGHEEPVRQRLEEQVRIVAAAADGEEDFFVRLRAAGLRVSVRQDKGVTVGYAVGLPGDRDGQRKPILYAGRRLAPDLSFPRVAERWQDHKQTRDPEPGAPDRAGRLRAWQQATDAIDQAIAALRSAPTPAWAATAAALGDLLTTAAHRAPIQVRAQLANASRSFRRAARAPFSRTPTEATWHLREAAHHLSHAGQAMGQSDELAAVLSFALAAIELVRALRAWHQSLKGDAAAACADATIDGLAGTARLLGAPPRPRVDPRAADRADLQDAIQQALPTLKDQILRDQAWPALAGMLAVAERAGHRPAAVLAAVASQRELGTAESLAQVLAWRLHRHLAEANRAQLTPADAPSSENSAPVPGVGEDKTGEELVRQALIRVDAVSYLDPIRTSPDWPRLEQFLTRLHADGRDVPALLCDALAGNPLGQPERAANALTWAVRIAALATDAASSHRPASRPVPRPSQPRTPRSPRHRPS